ncbi:diacylglycerol kinase family protein [Porphyromonas sp.]|uniref:diacylglycerol/lipid kinase family protein n=1 Tax=Porphyromonas sp. TaxID=1924944 RepID=UPI0026DABC96|nr:diacylglycerol kinase family protein [Porphyromonas sp.]MDO4695217.1 diacylglycerol kinase family lipid kinase [Porphyromonas sp.]MDO4770982.1 diacylglycerol kinase family lipid kinase [Porphyromonas sp.]
MKYLIIFNPTSGPRVLRNKVHEKTALALLNAGHEVRVVSTEYAGHATEVTKEALSSDIDVICAVGGDGTVNEIASALIGSDKILGIIPNGSGNGLARELNIPLSADNAIETLISHKLSVIDTCRVNDNPFLCTCGIGFDGSVSEEFSESNVRGPMVYIKDTVQVFFSHTPSVYKLNIDGTELSVKAFLIAFANAAQYGNNAFIAPNASLTDGFIDITIIKEFPVVDAAQVAIQLFSKGLDQNPYTELYKGKEITVSTEKPIPYHIDGEAMGSSDHISIKVLPASLKVISGGLTANQKTVSDFFNSITNNLIGFHNDLLNKLGIRDFDQDK